MPTFGEFLFAVTGWLAAAFGWIKWLHELREKRLEKAAKEAAQAALKEIQRRSTIESPLFLLSDQRFNGIIVPTEDKTNQNWMPAGFGGLLCFMTNEMDREAKPATHAYLLVDNHGSDAYEISIDLDGEPVSFIPGKADDRNTVYLIRYPYRDESRGRDQTIKISFLSANGVRDTHSYATKHGFRTLRRIDPA